MTARVLALCNQKGGVGKTTTTFHLARAAVRAGLQVLLVDLDPQGNLTVIASRDPVEEDQVGLADVLSTRAEDTIADVTVTGVWPGLTLVPTAGESLGEVRDELVLAGAGREARLDTALDAVRGDYDLILIDCPPSLDQLAINGLVAADAAVIITQSKLFSAAGLAKLLRTIDTVRQYYNPALTVAGVIVNAHEAATISGRHWLTEIAGEVTVLDPPVPKRALIGDAAEAAKGLDEWGPAAATVLAEIFDGYLSALHVGKGTPS